MLRYLWVVPVLIGFVPQVWAMDYYVSPAGSDEAAGTKQQPFATLAKACSALQPGDRCILRAGVYREVLRPVRSGKPGKPITFTNYRDEKVILTGADPLEGWREEGEGIYSAPMTWSMPHGNQVFGDGKMLIEACWPNVGEKHLFHPEREQASKGTDTTLTCEQLAGPTDAWKGARLWCAGGAAWICWTSTVTAYDPTTHTLTFDKPREGWYQVRQGSKFVLRGVRRALDAPGEWFYDATTKRLLLKPPGGTAPAAGTVEAKRRDHVIDLAGRSWVDIDGLHFRVGGIKTDARSHHLVLKNLTGRYIAHSYEKDLSGQGAVLIHGKHILLLSCDLGYSASSVVSVRGEDHRIINCHLHHGGYAGLWRGTVALSGRRIVFSHNTVRHAGRDLVNTHGLMESLVQHNILSDAGWLTSDLGMTYGHNTDFANTQFRYNLVHDNRARHSSMGIYFDHLSHNAIVHHNVIWNVRHDPIRFNNPSYGNLVFNNTCRQTGDIVTFDHDKRNDLFACRYFNNIFNGRIKLPKHVAVYDNQFTDKPALRDPQGGDFRLTEEAARATPDIGAFAPDGKMWQAGCDLDHPPSPLPTHEPADVPWMNMVRNACFEFGTLEGWTKTDAGKAELVEGNGWGNGHVGGKKGEKHPTGTSKYELKLGPGRDGVEQVLEGLSPNTKYVLSAWLRVSGEGQAIALGVKGHGRGEQTATHAAATWARKTIHFTTGPRATSATLSLRKTSPGEGAAWADNVTLPRTPAGLSEW
jgi:hypothetical protein